MPGVCKSSKKACEDAAAMAKKALPMVLRERKYADGWVHALAKPMLEDAIKSIADSVKEHSSSLARLLTIV